MGKSAELLDKREARIRRMFGAIAPSYDLLNHLLSLNIDRYWRTRTTRLVPPVGSAPILDLCTGTGDLALAYDRAAKGAVPIIGADFCHEMLVPAQRKVERRQASDRIQFVEADAQRLPFPNDYFQIVAVAFGLRNVTDTDRGIAEMVRVTQPGGRVAILEFSQPRHWLFGRLYRFYFTHILPCVGQAISRSRDNAYRYLPASVVEFPDAEALAERLRRHGLVDVCWHPFTFGIATLYIGSKRSGQGSAAESLARHSRNHEFPLSPDRGGEGQGEGARNKLIPEEQPPHPQPLSPEAGARGVISSLSAMILNDSSTQQRAEIQTPSISATPLPHQPATTNQGADASRAPLTHLPPLPHQPATPQTHLLVRAARGEVVERPPVWAMRQAGRWDPEFNRLRGDLSFYEFSENVELAARASLLPERFGVDAIILFYDITTLPVAMGLPFQLLPERGPVPERPVRTLGDVERLETLPQPGRFRHIRDLLGLVKSALQGRLPVIVFAGAPFTVAAYCIDTGKNMEQTRRFAAEQPQVWRGLLDRLTTATVHFLTTLVGDGADIYQLFDSWAGMLDREEYLAWAQSRHETIFAAIRQTPSILFVKECPYLDLMTATGANVISLGAQHDLAAARRDYPRLVFQGNVDEKILRTGTPEQVAEATRLCLEAGGGHRHIVNLSHGVNRRTPVGNFEAYVEAVKAFGSR